jgi:hypothetical protein
VWEEGLCHTAYMDAMLSCVGVSVGVCWASLAAVGVGVGEAVGVSYGVVLAVVVGLGV